MSPRDLIRKVLPRKTAPDAVSSIPAPQDTIDTFLQKKPITPDRIDTQESYYATHTSPKKGLLASLISWRLRRNMQNPDYEMLSDRHIRFWNRVQHTTLAGLTAAGVFLGAYTLQKQDVFDTAAQREQETRAASYLSTPVPGEWQLVFGDSVFSSENVLQGQTREPLSFPDSPPDMQSFWQIEPETKPEPAPTPEPPRAAYRLREDVLAAANTILPAQRRNKDRHGIVVETSDSVGHIRVPQDQTYYLLLKGKVYASHPAGEDARITVPLSELGTAARLAVKAEDEWAESFYADIVVNTTSTNETKMADQQESSSGTGPLPPPPPYPDPEEELSTPPSSYTVQTKTSTSPSTARRQNEITLDEVVQAMISGNNQIPQDQIERNVTHLIKNLTHDYGSQAAYQLADTYVGIDTAQKVKAIVAQGILSGDTVQVTDKHRLNKDNSIRYDRDMATQLGYGKVALEAALETDSWETALEQTLAESKNHFGGQHMKLTLRRVQDLAKAYLESEESDISYDDFLQHPAVFEDAYQGQQVRFRHGDQATMTISF